MFVAVNFKYLSPERVLEWGGDSIAGMGIGSGFPYSMNPNSVLQLGKFDKNVSVLTDSSFIVINSSGKAVTDRQHGLVNPVIDIADRRALIYEQGGKKLQIHNRREKLFEVTMQQNIIAADISEKGAFAVATSSNTATCEMKVYSRNFNELLTWYSSNGHIIDIALRPDGQAAAVAVISAQGGQIKSTIYIIDFKSEEPVAQFEYQSTTLLNIQYTSKSVVIGTGDNLVTVIGADNNKIEDVSYVHSSLKRLCSTKGTGVCALYSIYDSDNLNELLQINANGAVVLKTQLGKNVRRIDCSNGVTYTVSESTLSAYDKSGQKFAGVDVGNDCLDFVVINKTAYVLKMDGIYTYSVH